MTARSGPDAGRRATRVEAVVQIVIMLAIGTTAGAASFTHVHDLAAAHGQDGWLAWADAVVLELMSVAAGLEIRRRRRHTAKLGMPSAVLLCAVTLSLAAQIVQAEHSIIGCIAAAVPAIGFLTMVKIALGALGHQPHQPPEPPSAADEPPPTSQPAANTPAVRFGSDGALPEPTLPPATPSGSVTDTVPGGDRALPPPTSTTVTPSSTAVTHTTISGDSPVPATAGNNRPARNRTGTPDRLKTLIPAARQIAADLTERGDMVRRDRLVEELRAHGYAVSNAQAGRLLTQLDSPLAAATDTAPVAN